MGEKLICTKFSSRHFTGKCAITSSIHPSCEDSFRISGGKILFERCSFFVFSPLTCERAKVKRQKPLIEYPIIVCKQSNFVAGIHPRIFMGEHLQRALPSVSNFISAHQKSPTTLIRKFVWSISGLPREETCGEYLLVRARLNAGITQTATRTRLICVRTENLCSSSTSSRSFLSGSDV